jgi:hypothetical protein
MTTQQILIRLPEDVATRLKAVVPARKRNKFVANLVASAIADHEHKLGKIAAAVTAEEKNNARLRQETREWEATVSDGIKEDGKNAKSKTR